MTCHYQRTVPSDRDRNRHHLIKQLIIDVLMSHEMRPGDPIDVIRAEHETTLQGISKIEFSAAMVQFMDHGLIELQGNALCLTQAGFRAMNPREQGGHA